MITGRFGVPLNPMNAQGKCLRCGRWFYDNTVVYNRQNILRNRRRSRNMRCDHKWCNKIVHCPKLISTKIRRMQMRKLLATWKLCLKEHNVMRDHKAFSRKIINLPRRRRYMLNEYCIMRSQCKLRLFSTACFRNMYHGQATEWSQMI